MDRPLKLLIHGASGRMGRALRRLAASAPDLRMVAAVSRTAPDDIGEVAWLPAGELDACPDFDLAVDFSLPAGFDPVLALCRTRGRPLLSGTTGLQAAQREAMASAGNEIAVAWASNYSQGVAVLHDLVRRAAAALPDWSAQLVETHHVHKLDAPSGTALTLAAAVTATGHAAAQIESVREGEVIGTHILSLLGAGETISLGHVAHDRDIFAAGALRAARRLARLPPGLYGPEQLLLPSAGN